MASSITILSAVILSILYFAGFFTTQNETKLWETKITSLGQKSILTLIDGTVITLNANSELKYSTKFSNEKREVYLKGEAYFEVAHNPDVPFFVHSENIVTEVLGTKFNVKAFPNKNEISVALIEGKVKVLSEGNNSEVLLPNTQLLYNKMSKTKTINSLDVLDVIGWKDNLLKFNDEPLSEVFEELERTYGIKFELRDKSYSNKKIRAAFSNESFWTVVKVIEKATKLNYETFELNGKLNRIVFYE